jgi:hypothetical protein
MKRIFKIAAFVFVFALTVITLSSGVTKERSGGRGNLVEELYHQAERQNSTLENIANDIERFYKKKSDALEKYNVFAAYHNQYYTDAKFSITEINDSTIKEKAANVIKTSETAYRTKLVDWQNTIATLYKQEQELKDLQQLLKIMTTVPIIEKAQNSDLPSSDNIKQAQADLLKVIQKIKEITK